MKITEQLRAFFLSKGWIVAGADEATVKAAVSAKLVSGEFSSDDFAKMTADVVPPPASTAQKMIADELAKALGPIQKSFADAIAAMGKGTVPPPTQTPPPAPVPQTQQEMVDAAVKAHLSAMLTGDTGAGGSGGGMPGLLSRSAEILNRPEVRVKGAIEQYTHTKSAALYPKRCGISGGGTPHPFAERQAQCGGIPLDLPSQRDKAIAQAWWKWSLTKSNHPNEIPHHLKMTDHDKDLLQWALKNSLWSGFIHSNPADDFDQETSSQRVVNRRKLNDMEIKSLLDDSSSGGIEIAPIEFDDALVTIPVLYGELFPLVNVINVTRGRRMKGGIVQNPTFTSGIAEGTSITPMNTAAFVGAFDTSIYTAVAAFEIGLDFEEDSPTNIGAIIIQKYGEKALEWLDRVVAVGDGVTEPEGIFTSSAVTLINSDFSTTGPATVGDYEGLMFGVAKAFRVAKGGRNVFIGNDISYRRGRAIPVGPGDERRVFGLDHAAYNLLDTPYKIQINIPNSKLAFANMGFYRMYRRLGMNVRIETQGMNLATRNTKMIVVRMRYGGRIELGGAACIIQDAQS